MKKLVTTGMLCFGLAAWGMAAHAESGASTVQKTATEESTSARPEFDFRTRTVRLNSGHAMPILGIGVFTLSNEETELTVLTALKEGYRLIDTAHAYRNEAAVGRAVKQSGIPREQIFITTKLWMTDFPDAAAEIDRMLQRLDTPYIDLLLLHHPAEHDQEAYKAMEAAVKAGKVRSIGLSNYYEKEFAHIMRVASIAPAVVQNETHPYNQWKALKPVFDRHGTVIESWYPLGGRDRYGRGGTQTLFSDPVIQSIARQHGKSPAQVILRWHLQTGFIAIPGTRTPKYVKENIDIFDFELSGDEMARINGLDRQQRFSTF